MAHTTESANLVWQKVDNALKSLGASPAAFEEILKLKAFLAQAKRNPNLKFTPIDATTNGSDGSNADTVISDTANTCLVALYTKKGAGAVLAYDAIANHASAIQAQKEVLAARTSASIGSLITYPRGLKCATGITYASVTAYNGTTHSLAANSSNGFALSIDAELT